MLVTPLIAPLLVAGIAAGIGTLGAAGGAIGASRNNKKARQEENDAYRNALATIDSQYYRDPLTSVGNRALLKQLDQRLADNTDALNNRAVAGGATMENQLAARQSNNEVLSGAYANLLQREDVRRDALDAQKLQLDMNHSGAVQRSYLQNAQNWQQFGSALGNAAMQFGSAELLSKKA